MKIETFLRRRERASKREREQARERESKQERERKQNRGGVCDAVCGEIVQDAAAVRTHSRHGVSPAPSPCLEHHPPSYSPLGLQSGAPHATPHTPTHYSPRCVCTGLWPPS